MVEEDIRLAGQGSAVVVEARHNLGGLLRVLSAACYPNDAACSADTYIVVLGSTTWCRLRTI